MKDQLKRMRDLYNYKFDGTITEEMEVSDSFKNNNFQEDKKSRSVAVEVSMDPENDLEHRLALIMKFTNVSGYNELVFYFSLIDKNNQYVTGKETIYDKSIVKQYLPKELQGSIVFFNKLKEMFKKLITMEKPLEFYIETHDDYTDPKQLLAHNPIIELILNNGYMIKKQGLSHDKKKYYWKFIQSTKQQIKESKDDGFIEFINNHKRDEEYFKKIKEETTPIIEKMFGKKNKNIL